MKRRDFIKGTALAGAVISTPIIAKEATFMGESYMHDSADYAEVPEEDEEFQEYEIDVPEDWAEEEIVWI